MSLKEALEVLIVADRLFVLSPMEIAALNPRPAAWELALHNQGLAIYEELAKEASFMALDKIAKAQAVTAKAKEANPAGNDLVTGLLAAANGQ